MRYEVKALRKWYKTWQPAYHQVYTRDLWMNVSDTEVTHILRPIIMPFIEYRKQQKINQAVANIRTRLAILKLTDTNNPEAS